MIAPDKTAIEAIKALRGNEHWVIVRTWLADARDELAVQVAGALDDDRAIALGQGGYRLLRECLRRIDEAETLVEPVGDSPGEEGMS